MEKGGKNGYVKIGYQKKGDHICWKRQCGIEGIEMMSVSDTDLIEKMNFSQIHKRTGWCNDLYAMKI